MSAKTDPDGEQGKVVSYRVKARLWRDLETLLNILEPWWFQCSVKRPIKWVKGKHAGPEPKEEIEAVLMFLDLHEEDLPDLVDHINVFRADSIKIARVKNPPGPQRAN